MYLFKLVFLFSLGKYPEVELLGHMVFLFLIFLRKLHTVFHFWLYEFTLPPTMHKGSLFSTSSRTLVISCLFHTSHSDRCEVLSHCGFNLHFPDEWCWAHFHMSIWPSVGLLWKKKSLFKSSTHFLTGSRDFRYWVVLIFCIFLDINP